MKLGRSHRLSIRTKLLLLVLSLLSIPWMGYHYVSEMRGFLLQGQEDALLLTARAVSTVLHDRGELFNPETGIPEILGDTSALYAHRLDDLLHLDGRNTDWGDRIDHLVDFTGDTALACTAADDPESLSFSHVLGNYGRFLYALFEVYDDELVLRDRRIRRLDNSDHLRLAVEDPGGELRRYVITGRRPGRMSVYLMDEEWRYPLTGDPVGDITAVLRRTTWGYSVEMRIPRSLIGSQTRMGLWVADVDDQEARVVTRLIGTSNESSAELGRVLVHSPEIAKILHGLDRPAARIWILDEQQRVRAVVGDLARAEEPEAKRSWLGWLEAKLAWLYNLVLESPTVDFEDISPEVEYRLDEVFTEVLAGKPQAQRRRSVDERAEILMAAHPIWSDDQVLGAVVVEQSSNKVLALQNEVLQNVTTITLLVFLFVTTALLVFAWRLTMRISRLRNATERAISPEGRVRRKLIDTDHDAGDEIGDLSRGISSMLGRLSQYTRYLEGLPDTLAHELKNPLNVVNSSLDNLEKEVKSVRRSKYMLRAKNGIVRLGSILTNLTEAANLEEAMGSEDRSRFDLVDLVSSYVEGYQLSHPHHRFDLEVPREPLVIDGSPDHIAQMLDKLADNAVDFGTPDAPIVVRLDRVNGDARLSVLNEGVELPIQMGDRLFDPMISVGKKHAKQSHLGLGLYVVRLIAEFHEGEVAATNRSDTTGAEITVSLPLAPS